MFGINTWQILIILGIIILLFGTKKIRNLGPDLGGAIKGFRKAMNEETDKKQEQEPSSTVADNTDINAIDKSSTKKHEPRQ